MSNLLLKIPEYLKDNRLSAICIITKSGGSAPGKIGAKMVVFNDGSIEGTVGGGAIEKQIIDDALKVISGQVPQTKDYNLGEDLAMTCGGTVTVYIEPILKPAKLYIFGAGHIGRWLARYTHDMGFETNLIDWRADIFENHKNVSYKQIPMPYLKAVEEIAFDANTYVVIVTPGHDMDEDVLAAVGKKEAAYIGLIGSKIKIETLRKRFLKDNILTQEELDRVDMPIGIRFNAITPAEISISILAKLIDVRNNRASKQL